jgi:hypothetical protein
MPFHAFSGGNSSSSSGSAIIGDAKSGFQSADHSGWFILNGRAISTLTAPQQAAAIGLGFTTNLPNATGRSFSQGTVGAQIGSSTITQNQLPNVGLSVVGTASLAGNGIWWYNGTTGNARMPNGGGVFDAQSTTSLTVGGTTSSINGNVVQHLL